MENHIIRATDVKNFWFFDFQFFWSHKWMTPNSVFTPRCFKWSDTNKILWSMMPPRKSSVHMKLTFYNLLGTIQIMTVQLLMEKISTMGLVSLLFQIINLQTQNLYGRLFRVTRSKIAQILRLTRRRDKTIQFIRCTCISKDNYHTG